MFTQFKLSPAVISAAAVALAAVAAKEHPGIAPAQLAADTLAARLRRKPGRYIEFGPYWWAAKAALASLGHDFGRADDIQVRVAYAGEQRAYGAMVAAEQFREVYHARFLAGTNAFWLDEDGEESYVLFDPDMEARRLGGNSRVAWALAAVDGRGPQGDAGNLLDSALGVDAGAAFTPYELPFEHEAQLWRATVYAADPEAARSKLAGMGQSLAVAIDAVRGGRLMDSAGLHIDQAARQVHELASA